MAKKQYPSDKQDQFMLRLPDGLRDRIKRYAEKHGRSMNAEIVRILEREFPEPWPLDYRLEHLLVLTSALKESLEGPKVDELGNAIRETLEGIAQGQISGVSDDIRESLYHWLKEWDDGVHEQWGEEYEGMLDPEEQENFRISGKTTKIVRD